MAHRAAETPEPAIESPHPVDRHDRLRPLELLGLAVTMAVFTGLAVLLAIRDLPLAGYFAAAAFIVSLLVMATISITQPPSAEELADLDQQRAETGSEK